jgi:hypothetical protein
MDRTVPTGSHDLSEPFSIILVGLIDLHLERRPGVSGIQTDHLETSSTKLVNKPRRHRSGLNTNIGIVTCMAANNSFDQNRVRGTNTAPNPLAVCIDHANRRRFLRYVQANRMGHRSSSDNPKPPGQYPDHGIIGKLVRRRDYPMSTHGTKPKVGYRRSKILR